jgi:predicted HTH domain antitoxin
MNAATVTKSIRISHEESEELTRLSAEMAASETALLRRWIREGLRTQKIELAIRRYMQREVDLRGGAALAGVPYNRFLREVQSRNVVVLEDDGFLDRVAFLAGAFGDDPLQIAVEKAMAQTEP